MLNTDKCCYICRCRNEKIADEIQQMLENEGIDYLVSTGDKAGYDWIVGEIINKLSQN